MNVTIPSNDGQIAYVFGYNSDRPSTEGFDDKFFQYQTFGDGTLQHSEKFAVSTDPELFIEPLELLAEWCCDHWREVEDGTESLSIWHSYYYEANVKFAMSVKYVEGRRLYYSFDKRKVSSSEKLQHDKRYEVVPEWADGTPKSAFSLINLNKRWMSPWERIQVAFAFRNFPNCYDWVSIVYPDMKMSRRIRDAVEAINHYDEAQQLHRSFSCYKHNIENRRERAAKGKNDA